MTLLSSLADILSALAISWRDNALVDKVHEYIINHHSNKISRQDMANALNMSAKELSTY
jgi:YesN/AraC family two-component response regulator